MDCPLSNCTAHAVIFLGERVTFALPPLNVQYYYSIILPLTLFSAFKMFGPVLTLHVRQSTELGIYFHRYATKRYIIMWASEPRTMPLCRFIIDIVPKMLLPPYHYRYKSLYLLGLSLWFAIRWVYMVFDNKQIRDVRLKKEYCTHTT